MWAEATEKYKLVNLDTRDSGIDVIGEVPWGTHFCLFYQTKEDLIDILVPYFKAGLENNEYCMWVTSEPLNQKDAERAIEKVIPNFEQYLNKKQFEIIPHDEWYLKNNEFNSQRVLDGWIDKLNYGLNQGYKGLRLTGNTFWLEEKDWKAFTHYEEEVNNVIGNYNMIGICTYSLEKCGPYELLDVIHNHQFALIRREGKWTNFKSIEQIKSEEKWRSITENSSDFIMTLDKEVNIQFINRIEIPSLSFNDIIGKSIYGFISDNHKKSAKQCFKRVLNSGKRDRYNSDFTYDDGVTHYFESHVGPILKEGKIDGFIVSSRDITERFNWENNVQTSEKKLKGIMEAIPIGISITSTKGKIIEINSQAFKLLGYNSAEEFLNVPAEELYYDPKDREKFISLMKEDGYVQDFRALIKRNDGSLMWGSVSSVSQIIENQTVFIGAFQDITKRIKAEEEIADLSRFPSENPNPVLRVNEEFVLYVNKVGQDLFKIKEGNRIPNLLREIIKKAFEDYKLQQVEVNLNNRVYSLVITPVKGTGYINIYGMDITKRIQAEKMLRKFKIS